MALLYKYISNLEVKLYIQLLNVVVKFIIFLTLSTLICRCTNISKCFSELGIRDDRSRLYLATISCRKRRFITSGARSSKNGY